VYPSALAPLIFPTVGAAQVALWSAALGLDLALTASTGAIDILALSADAILAGPFAGWKTVNKQNKPIEQLAKNYASNPNMYVDTKGFVYEYNPSSSYLNIVSKKIVLPKKYWQLNKTIKSSDRDSYSINLKSEILDSSAFHAAIEKFQDPEIKLQYTAFPITKGRFHATSGLFSLLEDVNGFFYTIPFVLPYTRFSDKNYPAAQFKTMEIGGIRIKPSNEQVLYLLIEDNGSATFANQYHFNLGQHSNFVISDIKGRIYFNTLAGISYLDKNGISVWGIDNSRSKNSRPEKVNHELKRVTSSDLGPKSMSTIRCVAD
jgi:hypothetical protein